MNVAASPVSDGRGTVKEDSFLSGLLEDYHRSPIDRVIKDAKGFKLQIRYITIDRDRENQPSFLSHDFGVDPEAYFYPASTVKLPIALAALEKLNTLQVPEVDMHTPFYAWSGAPGSETMPTTIDRCIRKIFLVSDNAAANRLYEFVGQQRLNESLRRKGYTRTEILHRMGLPLPAERNRLTGPFRFMQAGKAIYSEPEVKSRFPLNGAMPSKSGSPGKDKAIRTDFPGKNNAPLEELLQMLQSVIFPGSVPEETRFLLSRKDYRMLYRALSDYPSSSADPSYDPGKFPPAYAKFLLLGGKADACVPSGLKIFNKSGWAYGFLTDVAYVADFRRQIEFMLGASLYTGAEPASPGDPYDYETTGKPFLGELGRAIYHHELCRPRKYLPDLTRYSLSS